MAQKEQIIFGFDPGLADTGFGIIVKSGSQLTCLDAGSIKTSKDHDFSRRLKELYQSVDKLIKKYQPDIVAVEKLYFAKNAKTALAVGQARGVILLAIRLNNCEILEFTPLQIKQAVCMTGSAHKEQVGMMVKTILGLQAVPRPDDASDALAAAITASFYNKNLA